MKGLMKLFDRYRTERKYARHIADSPSEDGSDLTDPHVIINLNLLTLQ